MILLLKLGLPLELVKYIYQFMYPTSYQIESWRLEHKRAITTKIGWIAPLEPLCYLCRIQESRRRERKTPEQIQLVRENIKSIWFKFHPYIHRILKYLKKNGVYCVNKH